MKIIIAGPRDMHHGVFVRLAVNEARWVITEVVSGGASGVDAIGEQIATELSLGCKVFPAQWALHGNSAGPIRNRQMAEYADGLIAVWDGVSSGTRNMIYEMQKRDKPVYVRYFTKTNGGYVRDGGSIFYAGARPKP